MLVYFHIGFPRTGSTFIQQNFFEKHSEIHYLGPKRYNPNLNFFLSDRKMNFINKLNLDNDLNLDNSNFLFKDLELDNKKINLISSEKFLTFEINYFDNLIKIQKLLKLQNNNIDFKVLFVIRNQFEAIQSYYYHAYNEIYQNFKVKNFKELTELSKDDFKNSLQEKKFFQNYLYDTTFKKVNNYFKKENICILFYETLDKNKKKFSSELASFFNLNLSDIENLLDEEKINALKKDKNMVTINNKFFPKLLYYYEKLNLKKIIPITIKNGLKKLFLKKKKIIEIPEENKKNVKNYFKKSNYTFENVTRLKLPKEYFE